MNSENQCFSLTLAHAHFASAIVNARLRSPKWSRTLRVQNFAVYITKTRVFIVISTIFDKKTQFFSSIAAMFELVVTSEF